MKRPNSLALMAALVLVAMLASSPGWSSRVFSDRVVGTITATPIVDEIEVDGHVYRVKRGSQAAQELHGFSQGQKVEIVLDGPADSGSSGVLTIHLRSGS